MFKGFRHLPKKTSEALQMESTWVSLGKINWPPFKSLRRMDYLGEFTTAYDLALSPVDLETGFYQLLQRRSICQ